LSRFFERSEQGEVLLKGIYEGTEAFRLLGSGWGGGVWCTREWKSEQGKVLLKGIYKGTEALRFLEVDGVEWGGVPGQEKVNEEKFC
jgi:hypothetical protein